MLSVFTLQAWAADDKPAETMFVNAAWLDDEILRLDVTDIETGINSSLALRLSDIINEADNNPYILIQAVDLEGNQSGIIQIKNPYYVGAQGGNATEMRAEPPANEGSPPPQNGANPFTPTGTGTVVDNATDGDGKEFLTIFTEDGNEFFLIIDRHRTSDNVYLLNTVTEEDLMSLADRSGRNIDNGTTVSGIPANPPPQGTEPPPSETPAPAEPEPTPPQNGGNNNIIIIFLVVAAVGGAAYYFKVVKGKNQSMPDDEEEYEDDGKDYDFVDEEDAEDGGDDAEEGSDDE